LLGIAEHDVKHLVYAAGGEVAVGVNQAGSSRETVEIDDSRGGARPPLDLRAGPHRNNLAFGDGDSFNDGVFGVDGQNLAADQNQIGSLPGSNSRQGEQ